MRDAVAAIFADRANLAATLVDARGVVRSMRSLLGGVVHAACCFLYLAIWDVRSLFSCFMLFCSSAWPPERENLLFLGGGVKKEEEKKRGSCCAGNIGQTSTLPVFRKKDSDPNFDMFFF